MKIALLFAGQLRDISKDLFRKSLSNLIKNIDYDIYAYYWQESGKSLNHSSIKNEVSKTKNADQIIDNLFKGFNIKTIESESFINFEQNLNTKYQEIIKSKEFHYGTVNSLAQIYTLYKCYKNLSKNKIQYDLIFRCRFDSLYVHPLSIYDLESIKKSSNLYTINFGRAFYPNRIYDIFFGGSNVSMSFLNDIWEKLPDLIYDKFDNQLDKRDSCRLLFLAAIKNDISINSFPTRICDVFRNFSNNYYEKYLISMHLIRTKYLFKNLRSIGYFISWFKYRKFKTISIIFCVSKTFLLTPLAYLKRIKYKL